jgi:hypothetical protein
MRTGCGGAGVANRNDEDIKDDAEHIKDDAEDIK